MTFLNSILEQSKKHKFPFDHWEYSNALNEGTIEEKDDRCTRIAKSKYDTWPSAYASGAVVRCRKGDIWKGVKEDSLNELKCKHGSYFCPHDKVMKCRKGPKKSRK